MAFQQAKSNKSSPTSEELKEQLNNFEQDLDDKYSEIFESQFEIGGPSMEEKVKGNVPNQTSAISKTRLTTK